ncbi:MAG: hypothetical protein KA248_06175 [Kiritimatiellae bacterium]|nr:hypothetical protein [Kiritimatiellia bacterium]
MKKSIILAWMAAGLAASTARGAVQLNNLSVYPTIQAAVNAATNGDTLKIEGGLYPELVIVSNKNLTLEGGYNGGFTARDGGDSVVDAQQAGTTLWIMDSSSRVDRVSLRGGTGYLQNWWAGGGGLLHRSWVEFTDCRLYSNTASFGGGLFVGQFAYAKLTGATGVYSNRAVAGGGLFTDGRCDIVHADAQVYGNTADGGHGGGIWVETGYLRLFQGQVHDNLASPGGGGVQAAGGGVGASGSFIEIGDGASLILNEAVLGGGLALFNSTGHLGRARLADCYLGVNSAASRGGGLYASNSALLARGLTVWANTSIQAGGGLWTQGCAVDSDTNGIGISQCRTEGHGGGWYLENTTARVTRLASGDIHPTAGNQAGGHGGGVYATNSLLELTGGWFANNTATNPAGPPVGGHGGAIALARSTLVITNGVNEIDPYAGPFFGDNHAGTNSGWGGAIWVGPGSRADVYRAQFTNNAASYGGAIGVNDGVLVAAASAVLGNRAEGKGGGLYAYDSDVSLWGSDGLAGDRGRMEFRENRAPEGGAVCMSECMALVSHSVFEANYSPVYAHGVLAQGGTLWMVNSLIVGGAVQSGGGAGLCLAAASTGTVVGCTLTENDNGGVMLYGSTIEILNSIVWGNSSYNVGTHGAANAAITFSDVGGGWPGAGNFDDDPLFYPDYHLRHGSPCVDAGGVVGSAFPPALWDIDGEPRPGAAYDVGFDEYTDTDGDRAPDFVETQTGICSSELDLGTNPNDPDTDGDSVNDADEWEADTNPNAGDDYLRFLSVAPSVSTPGDVEVTWTGGTQVQQELEWAENPDGPWQHLGTYGPPTPPTHVEGFAAAGAPKVFFRIRAYRLK